jgi:hypothetical protein
VSGKFFDRFLGLIETAEEELDPLEYHQILSDINRTSKDKLERIRSEQVASLIPHKGIH